MQRPKVVRITDALTEGNVSAETREPQEQASEQKDEQKAALAEEKPRRGTNGTIALQEKARKACEEATSTGDPVGFLMELGANRKAARERVRKWKIKYPEMFENMPKPKAPEVLKAPEEDDVSLEDFLSEYSVPQEEPEQSSDPMVEAMNVRNAELEAEKERLKAELERINDRIRCINEQQEALQLCLNRFRGV